MAEKDQFRGNSYHHNAALNRRFALARREPVLEPDPPIIDAHHYQVLTDHAASRPRS